MMMDDSDDDSDGDRPSLPSFLAATLAGFSGTGWDIAAETYYGAGLLLGCFSLLLWEGGWVTVEAVSLPSPHCMGYFAFHRGSSGEAGR